MSGNIHEPHSLAMDVRRLALVVPLALGILVTAPAAPFLGAAANAADVKGSDRDADNTGRNVRDRDDEALTPLDQGESEADRAITQAIRKAVVAKDELSTNAKNVKIITINGVVTLRGPVKTAEEKATIVALAKKASGAKSVDDQLEVETHQ